jgi:hypothetical protein
MKTYSLLQFLKEPINEIIDNEDEYCFNTINSDGVLHQNYTAAITKINIPIIQRDYVQGLKENEELLKGFISDLFEHLEKEIELKLDFIYGSLDKKQGNVFLPLDGQQRLTTLYLIHWYIIKKEVNSFDFADNYAELLSKFCYETRDTSRRFFKELINFTFNGNPKKDIKKSYWFSDHFSLDPTVKACLNTLEFIHETYIKSKYKGNLLDRLNKNYIVFYILPMDQFRLTDELYIKLNARGKVLSPFENFKADIINFLKTESVFDEEVTYNNYKVKKYDVLANKFDNNWANFFWQKAKTDNVKKKTVDSYFFRFIHRIILNEYLVSYKGTNINNDKSYSDLKSREENLKYFNFDFYEINKLVNVKLINELEIILDYYNKNYKRIHQLLTPYKSTQSGWSIYKVEYTMDDRIILDSINQYILYNYDSDFNESLFKDWMRIVWNLISDPDNRSVDANKALMTVVRGIAVHSSDILNALANKNLDHYIESLGNRNIYKAQLEEEVLKAQLILHQEQDEDWRAAIYEAESYFLYEGNIGFLLKNIVTPSQLRKRLLTSDTIFKEKGGDRNFSLTRYIISQVDNYNVLEKYNYLQSEINWKTNLRREDLVKFNILKLIDLENLEVINNEITQSLRSDSILKDVNQKQLISHKNLYCDKYFHSWMQNDGVYQLKWKEHRLYVVRPSAWYSKVMIDGFRNELINELNKRWKFDVLGNRCGESNYFYGEKLDYFKTYEDKKITFHFDLYNYLHIGLWGELNPKFLNLNNSRSDGWIECNSFNIDEITCRDGIESFIKNMENKIQTVENSLISTMFKP